MTTNNKWQSQVISKPCLTLRSTRTPPALPSALSQLLAPKGAEETLTAASTSTPAVQADFDFAQIRVVYQPPAPPYPPEAKVSGIQGIVVVELTIDMKGIPYSARALAGSNELRRTAEVYALKWRFSPALLNGKPQYARFKMTMPFRL